MAGKEARIAAGVAGLGAPEVLEALAPVRGLLALRAFLELEECQGLPALEGRKVWRRLEGR